MSFTKHPLLYVLAPLCIFAVSASFYRFILTEDYIVEYEGACDPETESCFVGCSDESCSQSYYYTWIQRNASVVKARCGTNVAQCERASTCEPGEAECSVHYCAPELLTGDEACDNVVQEIEQEADTTPALSPGLERRGADVSGDMSTSTP